MQEVFNSNNTQLNSDNRTHNRSNNVANNALVIIELLNVGRAITAEPAYATITAARATKRAEDKRYELDRTIYALTNGEGKD